MFCDKCGTSIPDGDNTCPKCGTKVKLIKEKKKIDFKSNCGIATKKINGTYKRIQEFLSPKGSYVLATIPFFFLYQYASQHIRISEKVLIMIITICAAILNIFMTNLTFIPICILMFFSLYESNKVIAILSVLLLFISSRHTNMVKKGKYQFPLLIMIMTACCSSSPIFIVIATLFLCSIMWVDGKNFLITPIVFLFNFLTISTTATTLSTVYKIFPTIEETIPLKEYFGAIHNTGVNFSISWNTFINLCIDNHMFYIFILIGFIIFENIYFTLVKKFRFNTLGFTYILISHIYAVIAFILIHQLAYYFYGFSKVLYVLNLDGNRYGALDSIDNLIALIPMIKDFLKEQNIITLHILDVLIAFIISLPLSIFVNGYDSQKRMESKGTHVDDEKSGLELGEAVSTSKVRVSWDDIAGYESTKQEIQDTISPYIDSNIMNKLKNAHMDLPKGILLFGPPGCGKTLFAQAIATESGMNFISVKGNEFSSKWVGESEKNLREIFESARNQAPCVIFFDEIDAFLLSREGMEHEHNKSVVTTFLTEMDGFAKDDRFFVVGATNNPDVLDAAAIRPGRFDKCVYIDTPNAVAREAILKKFLDGKAIYNKEELNTLVDKTRRYSGADMRKIIEETFKKNRFNKFKMDMLIEMLSHYKPTMNYEMQRMYNKIQAKYNRSTYSQEDVAINNHPKVTWDDAAGMDEVKSQIKDIIEKPLKFAKKYKELGIKYSKGILMYGPPGCGKTLVSKIIASEYDLYFIAVNGPEFLSKGVGESEEQIRKVFMEAKDNAPSVIFFDEFDSIAEKREMQVGQTKIINQLLTEMDGNEGLEGVIVIGATNRIETIDSALRRPGRFDKILYVGLPNETSREAQFKFHLKKLNGEYDFSKFAKASNNFTGADIEGCCKNIMIKELDYTIEDKKRHITEDEILDIINHYNRSLTDGEIARYEDTAKLART